MILGIGLSKTGTVSLSGALKILGYKSIHFTLDMITFNTRKDLTIKLEKGYDAYLDLPIARFYKDLDPRSKFIYTTRDIDSWIESCRKFFWPGRFAEEPELARLQEEMYGCVDFDEKKYREAYIKHEKEVMGYCRDKKFLVLNLTRGDGWEKLCPFLGQTIPTRMKFPHLNKIV